MPSPTTALEHALRDRYRIERELGRGGMATVYLARDLKHDRPVALKVLRDGGAPVDVERFHREIRVLAQLRHPFILPLHDSGEAAGALFFVMPYVDGESLRARLDREGRLPIGTVLGIARQVLDALVTAHESGVVHRDIKPENILITRGGHALLADFGIARDTRTSRAPTMTQLGIALGTVAYMSPEQALGEREIDARSDLYSLGCVLFEMLTGSPPFTGTNAMSVLSKRLTRPAPWVAEERPDVPPSLAHAVSRALAKEPRDRPQSAGEFASALSRADGTPPADAGTAHIQAAMPRGVLGATGAAARLSIAVLPIATIGGASDDVYFGEGLTEELTSALSRLEGLRVVSRTSASTFRGATLSLSEIAARLGVEFVIEGSVRRAGNRLRLTAKLIQASDDAPLWAETFDRTLDDVFAVQDEITANVVETIARTLQLGALRGRVPVATTHSMEAYDLYLLGRHHWNQRTEAGMRRARELFQQAIDIDPQYAPAWSGMADSSATLATWLFSGVEEMFPAAAAAARRAIALDPSLPDAHASLGLVKMYWEWDWPGVLDELHRAIALNPNLETAHRWLSAFLAGIGRFDAAFPIAERALVLDPLSVLPRMNLGIIRYLAGDPAAAEQEFHRVRKMQPGFLRAASFLAATLMLQQRFDEALPVIEELRAHGDDSPLYLWTLGLCHAMAGRTAEAHAVLDPIHRSEFTPLLRAMSHYWLGEREAAIAALREGVARRTDWMYSLGVQPFLRPLHGDPDFEAVLAELRLPPADDLDVEGRRA